jgi:hypothetical protein
MGIKLAPLLEHFQADADGALVELKDAFAKKHLRPTDFDLGSLFEACFGWHNYRRCQKKELLVNDLMRESLLEAAGAVSTAAFQNISGQIVYSAVMEKYQAEEWVFTPLIPEVPTQFLDGEKIAGITEIGDEIAVRNESDPYAIAGVGEDWIFTPPLRDRGVIIPVTWEAIFADRTGVLLERCGDVGHWGGQNREKRAIQCFVDEVVTAHRYNWRGTVIASYGDNSGTHTWDNLAASNALVDWTDIDAAEQVFNGLVDPYTGEPIMVDPKHIVVTKQNEQTARRIVSATEIRVATPGYATSANPTLTNMANPYLNKYTVVTSRLLAAQMTTDTDWFLADVTKVAKYMQAEKPQVVQAQANNEMEFHRRIVNQFRFNERGAYVVVNPRFSVKSTA